jgi:hypothetical protein
MWSFSIQWSNFVNYCIASGGRKARVIGQTSIAENHYIPTHPDDTTAENLLKQPRFYGSLRQYQGRQMFFAQELFALAMLLGTEQLVYWAYISSEYPARCVSSVHMDTLTLNTDDERRLAT